MNAPKNLQFNGATFRVSVFNFGGAGLNPFVCNLIRDEDGEVMGASDGQTEADAFVNAATRLGVPHATAVAKLRD